MNSIWGRSMRILIGYDHRGQAICNKILDFLNRTDNTVVVCKECQSEKIDYPDIASEVASAVSSGQADCGILICGTGIGMCVVANKYPGVRAAPCYNETVAELSRKHNDLNVLCLSGDMLGERSSLEIVEKWLSTPFEGGRHQNRLEKIQGFDHATLHSQASFS